MIEKGARSLEHRPVDSLKPYVRNPRTHSESQIASIAASIERFGFTNPILLDGANGIIAGHGRLLAAQRLNMQTVPCIDLVGLSKAEQQAYVIADNQLALQAGWDYELLREEIETLSANDIDGQLLGFSEAELAVIMHSANAVDSKQDAWEGMPEFDPEERAYRSIRVHFADDESVADFARRIEQDISPEAKYVWHPKKARQILRNQEWDDDGE